MIAQIASRAVAGGLPEAKEESDREWHDADHRRWSIPTAQPNSLPHVANPAEITEPPEA